MIEPTRQPVTLIEPSPCSGPGHGAARVEPSALQPQPYPTSSAALANDHQPEGDEASRSPQPGLNMGRSLAQILIVLVVLLVLVNVPINNYRAGLAQLVPQTSAMVIHDGLVLKGSGPEIYVLQDYKLRWISSPEAFDRYFNVNNVSIVEDSLLEQFGHGQPIRRLLKCQDSPTVYALENGRKRWVNDPLPANPANAWDRVELVSCSYLRLLPVGLPIPEDAGLPPQP